MKAYVFPGQGSQFPGMGKSLYESETKARELYGKANEILGFRITDLMFDGTAEDLQQTHVTQPAVFLSSVITALCNDDIVPDMTAGHSLGEFSALVVAGALSFEEALRLVSIRASAMQKACDAVPGTMAAVIGAESDLVESVCASTEGVVVAANYNCNGQIVISGENSAVDAAIEALKAAGVRKALKLKVGGAFHSPLMEPARAELASAIENCTFTAPHCPVYQNVDANPHTDPNEIRQNLLMQLTSPVRWTQSVLNMASAGATEFIEVGAGNVLQGLIKKIVPDVLLSHIGDEKL